MNSSLRLMQKREGHDSQATQCALSNSMTKLCPMIMSHSWQLDLAEALILGFDVTVIAGTGSGTILSWSLLLPKQMCDKICLVILLLDNLEADHIWLHCTPQRWQISSCNRHSVCPPRSVDLLSLQQQPSVISIVLPMDGATSNLAALNFICRRVNYCEQLSTFNHKFFIM